MSQLSELEGVVLGVIRVEGPCTAYRVRRVLRESPSTVWSASTGAIYPLLRKLEAEGLLEVEVDALDKRGRRLLRLSSKGRSGHLQWMMRAGSMDVASAVSDAVRSRAFFLATLEPDERSEFVRSSLSALEAFLERTLEYLHDRNPSDYDYWAALGGVYQAKARVEWMRALGDAPLEPPGSE